MGNSVTQPTQGRRADASRQAGFSLYGAKGGRKYLNRAERQRVLSAIEELEIDRALFALTLAWTGARVSEALALTPASFQIEGAGIVAIETLKRRRYIVREVPIPPELMGALDRHFGIAEAQHLPDATERRLWPWCRVTAWRFIKDAMRRGGVVGQRASPRGLRHSFAVGALQAGVPLNIVQIWLGHAKLETTAIYAAVCGPEEVALAAMFWRFGESGAGTIEDLPRRSRRFDRRANSAGE